MTDATHLTVYVSIGNSDDKLTQRRWSEFCDVVSRSLRAWDGVLHGEWYSLPASRYQNACWCVVFPLSRLESAQRVLHNIADAYDQDAVTWAPVPMVTMLGPEHRTHGPQPG